jgi:hypothetical protein
VSSNAEEPNYGYRTGRENKAALEAMARPMPLKAGADFEAPEEIDPRPWHRIEMQGGMGSCFPAGAKVTMADGSIREIQEVAVGDEVLTHTRRTERVTHTMKRSFTGKMVDVFVKGWGHLRMTNDHVVMVVRDGHEEWVRADELTSDDFMIVSPGVVQDSAYHCKLSSFIDMPLMAEPHGHVACRGRSVCDDLIVDDLTCFVLGLFVADGCVGYQGGHIVRVTWTLNDSTKKEHVQTVIDWCERQGAEAIEVVKESSHAIDVRCNSNILAAFFESECGRWCNHKKVPSLILRGTDEQKLAFIRGYFSGDGTLTKADTTRISGAGNVVTLRQVAASTASRVLAQQVSTLLVSLGMKPGRSLTKRRSHQSHHSYQLYLYGSEAIQFVQNGLGRSAVHRPGLWTTSGQIRPIRSIEVTDAVDLDVYDITVNNDHSFVCQGLVVHNCQGHALSSVCEMAYHIATGEVTQFSPLFAYLATQEMDGLLGRDAGSTIYNGMNVAKRIGMLPLDLMPYPNPVRYPSSVAKIREELEAAYKLASPFKIRNHAICRNYSDVFNYLSSGQGGVEIGIPWGNELTPRDGLIQRFVPGGGGHAVCFMGYSKRRDTEGRKYLWLANSWSVSWGNNGWAEVAPVAVDQMGAHPFTTMIGLSDLSVPTPRKVDWRKDSVFE